MLHDVVDDVFPEPQFDRNVLAKDDLAFKHVLVNEDHFDARHQVLKFLIDGQGPKGINWLGIADKIVYRLFGEVPVAGNLENQLSFDLGKMLVRFGQLDENIQLLLGNDINLVGGNH